jgi:hypothetical protein
MFRKLHNKRVLIYNLVRMHTDIDTDMLHDMTLGYFASEQNNLWSMIKIVSEKDSVGFAFNIYCTCCTSR